MCPSKQWLVDSRVDTARLSGRYVTLNIGEERARRLSADRAFAHLEGHGAGPNLLEIPSAPVYEPAMIRNHDGHAPAIAESAYVDASAQVIGRVTLGERASVWCNTTLRGDVNAITVGDDSNVQDNSCLHVDRDAPLVIGRNVVVGHSVTLHGCSVGDDCLIGMGAIVLSHARIGEGSIVAAGALVVEGAAVPPRSVVMGAPAKVRRQTSDEDIERIRQNAQAYVDLSRIYLEEL